MKYFFPISRLTVHVTVAVVFLAKTGLGSPVCPEGWTFYNNKCFTSVKSSGVGEEMAPFKKKHTLISLIFFRVKSVVRKMQTS